MRHTETGGWLDFSHSCHLLTLVLKIQYYIHNVPCVDGVRVNCNYVHQGFINRKYCKITSVLFSHSSALSHGVIRKHINPQSLFSTKFPQESRWLDL